MFFLTESPINREQLTDGLKEDQAGALVVFEGWVRNHNQGKPVTGLEYQVYATLAEKEGKRILEEACSKFNLHRAVCVHRYGLLPLGETAVWIGAIASHRDDAFKATRFIIDQIKLRLPIWKKEHYTNLPSEWVSCKDHATHVHLEESEYYEKQAQVVDQKNLRKARVLVVGAGGLGSHVLFSLASAGVGSLMIADHDRVSASNLHRQPLYTTENIGEKKATIAAVRLAPLNPFIRIEARTSRIEASNVEGHLNGIDLVLNCTDNLETQFLLHDACFIKKIPFITASIFRSDGVVRSFVPSINAGCLRCTQAVVPDDSAIGNCNDFGVLGAAVAVIGNLQAHEAITFLNSGTNFTLGETFYFNVKNLTQMKIKNLLREGCTTCAGAPLAKPNDSSDLDFDPSDLGRDGIQLVDIRDKDDSFLETFETQTGLKIVVYCHRGIRSRSLVRAQRAKGFHHFYSLKGGACSL